MDAGLASIRCSLLVLMKACKVKGAATGFRSKLSLSCTRCVQLSTVAERWETKQCIFVGFSKPLARITEVHGQNKWTTVSVDLVWHVKCEQ